MRKNGALGVRTLALYPLVCLVGIAASAQQDLHATISGHVYSDSKISVRVPKTWTVALDRSEDGKYQGAILRKGLYVLRLCTGCGQASGIQGGRFNEISDFVQPWFRVDKLGNEIPCGIERTEQISNQLNRVDFWFKRDINHKFGEDADDCRGPNTLASIWYGSYFAENCSYNETGEDCGGYFLHRNWLTQQHSDVTDPNDEMVFALTYDGSDLNQLPHEGNAELKRVLEETAGIVRSVHFNKWEK